MRAAVVSASSTRTCFVVLNRHRHLLFRALSYSYEIVLCAERLSRAWRAHILTIRLQDSCLDIIRKVGCQYLFSQPLVQISLLDREDHFASLDEVPGHPVRASAVDLLVASVCEAEDSAMLQKPPDNTAHSYPFAKSFDAGAQRTHPSNDQIDLDARLRRRVECLHRASVQKSIHLGENRCRLACFGMGCLAFDQGNQMFRQR